MIMAPLPTTRLHRSASGTTDMDVVHDTNSAAVVTTSMEDNDSKLESLEQDNENSAIAATASAPAAPLTIQAPPTTNVNPIPPAYDNFDMLPPPPSPRFFPPPPPSRARSASNDTGGGTLTRWTSNSSLLSIPSSLFDTQDLLQMHLFQSTDATKQDDELLRSLMQTSSRESSLSSSTGNNHKPNNNVSVAQLAEEEPPLSASVPAPLNIPTPVKDAASALVGLTGGATTAAAPATVAATTTPATTGIFASIGSTMASLSSNLFNSSAWSNTLKPSHVDVDYAKIFPESSHSSMSSANSTAAGVAPSTATAAATATTTTTDSSTATKKASTSTDYLSMFLNQLPPPLKPPPAAATAIAAPEESAKLPRRKRALPSAATNNNEAVVVTRQALPDELLSSADIAGIGIIVDAADVETRAEVAPRLRAAASIGYAGPAVAAAAATATGALAPSHTDEDQPIIPFSQVTDKDVLLGRGGRTNHHAGNVRYLAEKERLQPRYLKATKDEKTIIAQELVDAIKNNGGRFLKLYEEALPSTLMPSLKRSKKRSNMDDDEYQGAGGITSNAYNNNINTQWFEIDNLTARKKASQTLRELNTPEMRAAKRAKYTTTASSSTKTSKSRKRN